MNRGRKSLAGAVVVHLRLFSFCLLTVFVINRIQASDYQFRRPIQFSGHRIYNPYTVLPDSWGKANFHAHARAYGGFTNGKQAGSAVVDAYLEAGYTIAGVSDYFRVNPDIHRRGNLAVTVFEHGLNPIKAHQLVIGSQEAVFEDILLFQNDHTRQFVLDRLARLNAFVCIAHPRNRNGYPASSLKRLTGFHAIEVFNGPHRALAHWDSALSAGQPVWAMANDDVHDIHEARFGRSFNLLPRHIGSSSEVVDVLRDGAFVAVHRRSDVLGGDSIPPLPVRVFISDSSVRISFDRPFRESRVVGQGGKVKFVFRDEREIFFYFGQSDTYLRVEVEAPGITAYLNPFFRTEVASVVSGTAANPIDDHATSQSRALLFCLWVLLSLLLLPCPPDAHALGNSFLQYLLGSIYRFQRT